MTSHRSARYGRYAGGPDPLAPPLDLAEALAAVSQDVMSGYSPRQALREFLRRGSSTASGLDELASRVQRRRRDLLAEHKLDGTLSEVKRLLDGAVLDERKQLARDLDLDDLDREFRELRLANLPASTAAAVRELSAYDWRSPSARAAYEQIRDLLGRELLDQRFGGMKQALEGATEADRQAVREMLSDLNDLLDKHRLGEDTDADFERFRSRHSQFFPEGPRSVEELIDTLARRSAAAQRMLNSMTPEQRAELGELSAAAFGTPALIQELGRLDANLQSLRPGEDWGGSAGFGGENGLGLGDGTSALQDLAELDALAEQLGQDYGGARPDDLDLDALARQLGEDASVSARTLAELERALRDGGYLRRGADGDLRLSPRAIRHLGRSLLRDVVQRLSGRQGQRATRLPGAAGEVTGAARPWEFGDTGPWDTTRTMLNAMRHADHPAGRSDSPASPSAPRPWDHPAHPSDPQPSRESTRPSDRGPSERPSGARPRVRIRLEDVEVVETETRTQAAVALLVDTSFSMAAEGRWLPMKRTALALHHLVATRFRGDQLHLVGFGRHARAMQIEELIGLPALREQGTNLHHGLLLAERFFRRHPTMEPVLLVVTDGEPTAHLSASGQSWFAYPPEPETIRATIAELDRLIRAGTRVTFFRLGDDPALERFVRRLADRTGGRVVSPDPADLGAAVVGEYLDARLRRTSDFDWED